MNILTKFGSNCPSGLREEDEKQTKPFYTPLDLLFPIVYFRLANKT